MTLARQIDSSLPMLGGRVERLFAEQVRAALDEDHCFTLRFLQRTAPARGGGVPQQSGADARPT